MEEAIFLTKYANRVYIIHRRDKFRASKIMQDRLVYILYSIYDIYTLQYLNTCIFMRLFYICCKYTHYTLY